LSNDIETLGNDVKLRLPAADKQFLGSSRGVCGMAQVAPNAENVRQTPRYSASLGGIMRFGPFLGLAILLAILWVCGFLMFHVASGLIHLLLLFAVISLVIHLFSGSRATT
jgi:hypothetical protein